MYHLSWANVRQLLQSYVSDDRSASNVEYAYLYIKKQTNQTDTITNNISLLEWIWIWTKTQRANVHDRCKVVEWSMMDERHFYDHFGHKSRIIRLCKYTNGKLLGTTHVLWTIDWTGFLDESQEMRIT